MTNTREECIDPEQITLALSESAEASATELLDVMLHVYDEFKGEAAAADDLSVLVAKHIAK